MSCVYGYVTLRHAFGRVSQPGDDGSHVLSKGTGMNQSIFIILISLKTTPSPDATPQSSNPSPPPCMQIIHIPPHTPLSPRENQQIDNTLHIQKIHKISPWYPPTCSKLLGLRPSKDDLSPQARSRRIFHLLQSLHHHPRLLSSTAIASSASSLARQTFA